MPKFSPLRLVTLVTLWMSGSWLSLALLYAFLPSLPHTDVEAGQRLSKGARVTQVYNTDDFYSWHDPKSSHAAVRQTWRSCFALDYKVEHISTGQQTWLHVGNASIDLLEYRSGTVLWKPMSSDVGPDSFISDPIEVNAKIGDLDGINLPWFQKADAMLLFNAIHMDEVIVPLRIQVLHNNAQLWPDGQRWDDSAEPPYGVDQPLIEFHNINVVNGTRIAVSLPRDENNQSVSFSPSRTFFIRKNVQAVLVPTGLLVYHLLSFLGVILKAMFEVLTFILQVCLFYAGLVILAWVLAGRPEFRQWLQSSPLTRIIFARFRKVQQRWPAREEHRHKHLDNDRQPHPLRGPLDFFRSSNPLDDLLVTFDCTKGLVQPISFWRKRRALGEDGQIAMPNEIKLDVSRSIRRPSRTQRRDKEWEDVEKGIS